MNLILTIPLPLRLALLFALGMACAGFINWGAYRLAWNQRSISPWSIAPPGVARRRWSDRLPLAGWWALRREVSLHGRGFWVRPLAIELITGLLFAGLYYWETVHMAPWLLMPQATPPPAEFLTSNLPLVLHVRYAAHLLLVVLMLTASLIDIDEKTIPDAITVPGTLLGLALAAAYPWSLLPGGDWIINNVRYAEFLSLTAPNGWPADLDGWPARLGPAVALGCWTLWCGGLLPRYWNLSRGLKMAVRVFVHRLRRSGITYLIAILWLAGLLAIGAAAVLLERAHWAALLTALVGMAASGGMIWVVRNVGRAALGREAMGFGDVTLMAMIGAFIGWQAALIVFFLAPFAGLLIAVGQWIVRGEREIPYGPFLCVATFFVLVQWIELWGWASDTFSLGWLVPAFLAGAMVLMGGLLVVYRLLLQVLSGRAR